MKHRLERYLNHHLAGSAIALSLLDTIISERSDVLERSYYSDLKLRVRRDQKVLRQVLDAAGLEESNEVVELAGPRFYNEIVIFEALEALALRIQGKRLLWQILNVIAGQYPGWADFDFNALEKESIAQRELVEAKRIDEAQMALKRSVSTV